MATSRFSPLRRLLPLAALGLAASVHADAATPPPAPAPTLGAHTLLVQSEGKGSAPAVSAPIDIQPSGSSLLTLVASYTGNVAAPSDNYGNRWQAVGDSVYYRGYDERFAARAYVATRARGGQGLRVSFAKTSYAEGEITAPVVEIEHAGTLQDVAQNYPAPGLVDKLDRRWHLLTGGGDSRATLTSGQVVTTGPATLVAVWWGDSRALSMSAAPGDGFKVIDQLLQLPPNSAVQCVVAVKQVDRAGRWDVSWSGSPAQGAILWLFAFQATP